MNPDKAREWLNTKSKMRNMELMDKMERQHLKHEREIEMLKMKNAFRSVPLDKFAVGEYVNVPDNFSYCYRATFASDGTIVGLDRPIGNVSAMNAVIIKRFEAVLDVNGNQWDYIVVENEDEKFIGLRITEELREVNQ